MRTIQEKMSPLFAGFYTWLITVYFGAVLLDIIYSNLVPKSAVSEVSDLFLFFDLFILLTAVSAIFFTWKSNAGRNYFVASLLVFLFEFLIPIFFSQFIQETSGPGYPTIVRITINLIASLLAFLGFRKFNSRIYKRGLAE